jgi:hypothetical protein
MKVDKKQRVREREDRTIQDTTYFVLGMMFLAFAVTTQFFG